MNENLAVKDNKKIISIGIIITAIVILSSIVIYSSVIKPQKYSEYLDLGNKYLLEGNYEEAILAFEKAIKIDEKSTEARVGAAKGYIGINDVDNAVEHLRNAQSLDIENEKLTLEILDIISKVDENIANDLLNKFLDKVGIANVSESFKANILENTNKKDLNTYIKQAQELYDSSIEGRDEGQYKPGSKAKLLSSIEKANKIKNNYFASQDDINNMSNKLKKSMYDFEENKVKVMPTNLGDSYISRLQKIENETDVKFYNAESNADMGSVLHDAQLKYEGILNEIFLDLDKYLSLDKKSQFELDKSNYKNEKAQLEYDFDNIGPEMSGTWIVTGIPEAFGNLAKDYCYDLIEKYMK